MDFDRWWAGAVKAYKVPKTAPLSIRIKTLASVAWSRGFGEGCKKTREQLKTERGDNDAKAGNETV